MTILKKSLTSNFTQIPNEAIEDMELSAIAFRMYAYLISRPDNWKVNNTDIKKRLGIKSNETMSKYLHQLINAGWLFREKTKDSKNRFTGGYSYYIFDKKNPNSENFLIRKKSKLEKNPKHSNTDFNTNTNSNNNTNNKFPSGNLYKKTVDLYFKFYKHHTGVNPKFDATQGSSLKKLLKNIAQMGGEWEEDTVYNTLYNLFRSWKLLDNFHQKQLELRQINGNLNNIVAQIKLNGGEKLTNSSVEFKKFLDL